MFYVKSQTKDGKVTKIEITDENVFTNCPACGLEIQVDIKEVLDDGDLFGTSVICWECHNSDERNE